MVKGTSAMKTDDLYRRDYDAILVNLTMLEMNEIDLVTSIRKLNYTGKIIGMTSNPEVTDMKEFLNVGNVHVLVLPLEMSQLYALLDL
jgi:DNA-binding response OmpR family regulator